MVTRYCTCDAVALREPFVPRRHGADPVLCRGRISLRPDSFGLRIVTQTEIILILCILCVFCFFFRGVAGTVLAWFLKFFSRFWRCTDTKIVATFVLIGLRLFTLGVCFVIVFFTTVTWFLFSPII